MYLNKVSGVEALRNASPNQTLVWFWLFTGPSLGCQEGEGNQYLVLWGSPLVWLIEHSNNLSSQSLEASEGYRPEVTGVNDGPNFPNPKRGKTNIGPQIARADRGQDGLVQRVNTLTLGPLHRKETLQGVSYLKQSPAQWWAASVVPATWEFEAGRLLELISSRPA